ncbi:pilus assembly protein [Gluconacetobacter sp. 1b LMG 1731]|uniref:Pilus assembly protein n=1 Tax=Gluconacetobacter dulcium TaxID=2729096 RepID=A0A7W4K2G9_9PROT|nr:TadE family protein [Gluconacetobacter dulcium]MBB2163684.1 pilus assembly protein [Gluconacetobacter dulcium]MBB2192902.1 pilus assembly protein [Gluconacetobacter dulcium]MBB2198977.1 pilus assembly protein [Gluconacetobacter dulcium]
MTGTRRDGLGRAGVAALEFALVTPFLLAVLAGLADFPLAFWDRMTLISAVESGANYAFAVEQNASGTHDALLPGDVRNAVLAVGGLPGMIVTVGAATTNCIQPGTVSTLIAVPADGICPDGTLPGTYMSIAASYRYAPLMPFYAMVAPATLTDMATVRLQ